MGQTSKTSNIIIPPKRITQKTNDNLSLKNAQIEIKKTRITKLEHKKRTIISN